MSIQVQRSNVLTSFIILGGKWLALSNSRGILENSGSDFRRRTIQYIFARFLPAAAATASSSLTGQPDTIVQEALIVVVIVDSVRFAASSSSIVWDNSFGGFSRVAKISLCRPFS